MLPLKFSKSISYTQAQKTKDLNAHTKES